MLHQPESTYGSIESGETILCKFYSCKQQPGELLTTYISRLEEFYAQAVTLKALEADKTRLKRVLYEGLQPEPKDWAEYKMESWLIVNISS